MCIEVKGAESEGRYSHMSLMYKGQSDLTRFPYKVFLFVDPQVGAFKWHKLSNESTSN